MGSRTSTAKASAPSLPASNNIEPEYVTINDDDGRAAILTKGEDNPKWSPLFSRGLGWWQDSWALEYLALSVSMASMVAIFSILLYFHDKSLDIWNSSLSVNTVLSILATVLKSFALLATASALGQLKWVWYSTSPRPLHNFQVFDSATRGPLGALVLLWRRPLSVLACLGSIIMIATLGLDAAIQASASQPLRPRFLSTDAASVPIATIYDAYWPRSDPLLVSAFYTGVLDAKNITTRKLANQPLGFSGKPVDISPFCSTGNCTFEPYASLTVSHRCSNITEALHYEYTNKNNSYYQVASLSVYPTIASPIYVDKQPDYDTRIHLSSQMKVFQNTSYANLSPIFDDTEVNMTCVTDWSEASTWPPTMANATRSHNSVEVLPLAEVYMIILPKDTNSSGNIFEAFRCNLDFGMRVYTASVSQGQFVETASDFIQGNWTFEPDDSWDGVFVTDDTSHWSIKAVVSGKEHQAAVKFFSWYQIINTLPKYLIGSYNQMETSTADDLLLVLSDEAYASRSVDMVFENIAQSLTTYLRTASGDVATGTTVTQEQYIHVRWPWLIGPLMLVVLNTIFVLAVRLQSRRLGLPSWRNNALASFSSEQTAGRAGEVTMGDYILIGPPEDIEGADELNKWSRTRLAVFRGGEQLK